MDKRARLVLQNYVPRIGLAAATLILGVGSFFWVLSQSKTLPTTPTRQIIPQVALVMKVKTSTPSSTSNLGSENVSGSDEQPNHSSASPVGQSLGLAEDTALSPVVQTEVDPITGATLPCPQPNDPLAQLTCFNHEIASENLVFAQVSLVLQQEQGGYQGADIADLANKSESEIKTKCALDQADISALSSRNPSPQIAEIQACVISSYSDQITLWKSWLQRSGAEEANRSIEDQITLERRLQDLGFLSNSYDPSGLADAEAVQAINAWKASVGLDQDGLLGDADAQALLGNTAVSQTEENSISSGDITVEYAWIPFFKYGSCLLSAGNSIGSFIDSGTPPTDPDASSAIEQCTGIAIPSATPKTVRPPRIYSVTRPAKQSNPLPSTSTELNETETDPSPSVVSPTANASQPAADSTKAAVISSWLNKN